MIYSSEADIVPFVKGIVQCLQPYARANDIRLSAATESGIPPVLYQPYLLSTSIIHLVCNMISLLPPKSSIQVRLEFEGVDQPLKIRVANTGIDLIRVHEIQPNSGYCFTGQSLLKGSCYSLSIPFNDPESTPSVTFQSSGTSGNLPQFYREIQKRLTSHFSQTEKLISSLEKSKPREAAFLQKVNTLIQVSLEDENFDTDRLCEAMCMSRTQLFRKMKSLVRQAPANYIRSVRLHKAKELLETTDLTISEIGYRTGFQTISHFTRIFKSRYGIPPRVYRGNNHSATNG
jgi:AraC-like DNA-binding protein